MLLGITLIVAQLEDGASRILLFESGCPLAGNLRDIEISSFACAALPPLVESQFPCWSFADPVEFWFSCFLGSTLIVAQLEGGALRMLLFESGYPLARTLRGIEIYNFACAALPPLAESHLPLEAWSSRLIASPAKAQA